MVRKQPFGDQWMVGKSRKRASPPPAQPGRRERERKDDDDRAGAGLGCEHLEAVARRRQAAYRPVAAPRNEEV
jgi:hypothetical protein